MKILLLGVIYQTVEPFLDDYFCSIKHQTYDDFDVLILEDNYKLPGKYYSNRTFCLEVAGKSMAAIRLFGINYAIENNYDLIIFTDCDDYYSSNRVQVASDLILNYDFTCNKIIPVNNCGEITKYTESLGTEQYNNLSFREILNRNYFGLSNTALRIKSIPSDFDIPIDIIAVDWWIYSLMLVNQKTFKYCNNAITYYRQHTTNLIGINKIIDEKKIFYGINVKLMHYQYLYKYLRNFTNEFDLELLGLIKSFEELKMKLLDKDFLHYYLLQKQNLPQNVFNGWWGEFDTVM